MTAQQIIAEIANSPLNSDGLRSINTFVIDLLKAERKVATAVAKSTINIGSIVRVNHPKTTGQLFEVVSIRRSKASVRRVTSTADGSARLTEVMSPAAGWAQPTYSVPLSIVEAVNG